MAFFHLTLLQADRVLQGDHGGAWKRIVSGDEDFPAVYLLFVLGATVFIAVTALGAFVMLLRN